MRSIRSVVAASLAAIVLHSADVVAVDPCGQVAQDQKKIASSLNLEFSKDVKYLAGFDAETAYKCVTSISLDKQDATDMIAYLKKYFAFQSTLSYLSNPPKSYQQLPVDVMGRLDNISKNIGDGVYQHQYEVELDIQSIVRDAHEGHLAYTAGVIGLFTWFLPEGIVSVSSDGQQIPQVFTYSDVVNKVKDASPIVEIEGESTFKYLRSYLERSSSIGLIDPHGDWNQLMGNTASFFSKTGTTDDTSIAYSFFQATTIYNGASLSGKFANGTGFEWAYKAGAAVDLSAYGYNNANGIKKGRVTNVKSSSSTTMGVQTTEKEIVPAYLKGTDKNTGDGSARSSVPSNNYPTDPIVVQSNFSVGGVVSGYLLENNTIGVLSIPDFETSDYADAASFSDAVKSFISKAKEASAKKIVIDVSGNGGGTLFLAFDVFKQFFPKIEPTPLFRARAIPDLRTYGKIISGIIENKDSSFESSIVQSVSSYYDNSLYLNVGFIRKPNGSNWGSYDDFFGPNENEDRHDNFTNNANYDYSSGEITEELGFPIANHGTSKIEYNQPWEPEDIILLTDGYCSSTCHTFATMMKTDAGVKNVVVGGIPQNGPMQAVCGTRGSNNRKFSYISGTTDTISNIRSIVGNQFSSYLSKLGVTDQEVSDLPKSLEDAPWYIGTDSAGVNMLDTILPSNPDVPRQFVYEAANCRLFWTGDMVRDITQLWKSAAKYANGNDSVCVPDSLNGPGSKVNDTILDDPGYSYNKTWDNANSTKSSSKGTSSIENSNSGDNSGEGDNSGDGNSDSTSSDKSNGGDGKDTPSDNSATAVYSFGMASLVSVMFVIFLQI